MRFFKKKKVEKNIATSRVLPEADLSDFVPPVDPSVNNIKNKDVDILKNLQTEFIKSGVLEEKKEEFEQDIQKIDELLDIMRDANEHAKSEKDFNKNFYDEDVDQFFDNDEDLQNRKDFDNPVLDGVDDFGNQVYDDYREKG